MDDDEFERKWYEDGQPQEQEVKSQEFLSAERTAKTIQVIVFSLGAIFLGVSAYNLLPVKGLAPFVPILFVVGILWWERRKERKAMEAEGLTDEDLDRLLGREVK